MTVVYLGGPITGLTFDEARAWRLDAAAWLAEHGVTTLDPLRGKEQLGRTDTPLTAWFDGGGEAVYRDLRDITVSDIVLLNFQDAERVSIGTCAEMGYAACVRIDSDYYDPPEVVVVRNTDIYDHVFVDYMADKTFETLEQALEYIIGREIDGPEGGSGVHGAELPDSPTSDRGWVARGDETAEAVAGEPVRPPEVVGVRAAKLTTSIPNWVREKYSPNTPRIGW